MSLANVDGQEISLLSYLNRSFKEKIYFNFMYMSILPVSKVHAIPTEAKRWF